MILRGDFPQTKDLTLPVRQREMINMLIEGPSVQVLKEATATSVSVINNNQGGRNHTAEITPLCSSLK